MLTDFPVVTEVVVRWGEMDALGHVNNIIYLQYFETARVAYLERLGLDPPGPTWRDRGLIIASLTCRFRVPVVYPDTLSVGARVKALGEDRLIMEHTAVSRKVGKVAALGEAEIVSYDYAAGRRAPMPAEWRAGIIDIEGREPTLLPPRRRLRSDGANHSAEEV